MFRSRKPRRPQQNQRRKRIRLELESLEERVVPSGTAVSSGQDLLNALKPGGNVSVSVKRDFTLIDSPKTPAVEITSGTNLTVNGSGYTLTAAATSRLFQMDKGASLTLVDVILTGGAVTSTTGGTGIALGGGAILAQGGNVTLSGAIIEGNSVTGKYAKGGGVYVTGGGKLTVSAESLIQDNNATDAKGGFAEGGGIVVVGGSNLVIQGGSTIQTNRAIDTAGGFANGGGVYFSGGGTVQITDSTLNNNLAQGGKGADGTAAAAAGNGGNASGGGLYVFGKGWTTTLSGDTLSNNKVIGGNGGKGAAGSNAAAANTSGGNGGAGGNGGNATGGAAFLFGIGSSNLTMLNDSKNPSRIFGNTVQSGAGGAGGAGGASTGTATNSNGGAGGNGGLASGGAISITGLPDSNHKVGNSSFYGNNVSGGNGGGGGGAGTGGSGAAGTAGAAGTGGSAKGGGLAFSTTNITVANCTVAKNTVTAGTGGDSVKGTASGGGIAILNFQLADDILLNNTITQNTISGGKAQGAGFYAVGSTAFARPYLINSLVVGNQGIGAAAVDLYTANFTLSTRANNNFVGTISPGSVDADTNFVGVNQQQLGNLVGVDGSGKPSGGPIYYPLLPGVKSIGGGDTTATVGGGNTILGTIAAVEGTTTAKITDEIGQPRTAKGAIDIGAFQTQPPPPPPPPPPSPPGGGCSCATSAAATANQMLQNLNAYVLKIDLQMYESGLRTLDSAWTQLTGKPPLSGGSQDALYLQVVFAYYRLFTTFLPLPPLSQEPATTPEQSGATGAEESFAASTPVVIGD